MISVEFLPERKITLRVKPNEEVKPVKPLDSLDPSGILKQTYEEETEALTEMNQIVGVQPTLLGS